MRRYYETSRAKSLTGESGFRRARSFVFRTRPRVRKSIEVSGVGHVRNDTRTTGRETSAWVSLTKSEAKLEFYFGCVLIQAM